MKKTFIIAMIGLAGASGAYATEPEWKNEGSLSYSQATGNTRNSQLTVGYEGTRTTDRDELTLKAKLLNSTQNKKMDGQKYSGSARYAPNVGDSQWYVFGEAEVSHDRFAEIDYRLLPSLGAGYTFSDTDDWKLKAEIGLGYEYINYSGGSDEENIVLVPRGYAEKRVFEKATVSEELIYYPSLEDAADYRVRSESRFTNALSESLALRFSFIDEFNSAPVGETKKNDTELLAAVVYSF